MRLDACAFVRTSARCTQLYGASHAPTGAVGLRIPLLDADVSTQVRGNYRPFKANFLRLSHPPAACRMHLLSDCWPSALAEAREDGEDSGKGRRASAC